jgi:hypothetical protein
MARTIGATTDILLSRVRRSGNITPTNDFAIQVLTTCQQYANILLKQVIVTETFATTKEKLFYALSDFTANNLGIASISESNRELFHCQRIEEFSAYENGWFRNITGTRFEAWHQIALDSFILYPGKAAASSISADLIKATTISTDYTTDYADAFELADEDVEIALKLAEIILLIQSRETKPIVSLIKSLTALLKAKNVVLKSSNLNALLKLGA